jgi:glyoxylase-like metal-dependent hydrolase (beta-lactamase superfamily II)
MDTATVNVVPVTGELHMLTGPGGNIGVSSGADGIFLIDDQYAPLTAKIRAALATIDRGAIRFVLNTHWHGDHTGGNENLGQSGTIIVAQDNVRTRMSADQLMEFLSMKETVPASPKVALPVVTFGETITFFLNEEEIHAFHIASAHTDGDAVIHFRRANVVHTGDIYFNGLYPFIDISSGGSLDGMIAAATRILGLVNDSTRIIPGHGPLAKRSDLLAYRDMLATIRDRVRASIRRGRSLAQTVADKPTAEFDAAWGRGFLTPDDFVGLVYTSLQRGAGR